MIFTSTTRRHRFACRVAICALVVFGQLIGAFGWAASTTITSKHKGQCGNRPCGCVVVSDAAHCCCDIPEPAKPSSCEPVKKRSCCEKTEAKPVPVTKPIKGKGWIADMMAQPCHGEAPPSAVSGDPEIPPSPLDEHRLPHEPAERLIPISDPFSTAPFDPPIPPPRLG